MPEVQRDVDSRNLTALAMSAGAWTDGAAKAAWRSTNGVGLPPALPRPGRAKTASAPRTSIERARMPGAGTARRWDRARARIRP